MKKAIITADGLYREFVPLSLEKPKALWKVRGEKLVERLINQAREAGIMDITVVTGPRVEVFAYLKNEFAVSLAENINIINQAEAMIYDAGNYYIDNPFTHREAETAKINTLDELRLFDSNYLLYSGSNIVRNIRLVFRCEEDEISEFRYLDRQQTNVSFVFKIKGVDYVYRHPADGISEYVDWKNETRSMVIAKELGIDPTFIYADFREGWKIMEFIGPHGKPDYASFEDSKKIIKVLRKLHSAEIVTDYGMKPWEDSEKNLEVLRQLDAEAFTPFEGLRDKIRRLYEMTLSDGVKKCFCHGDTYRPNWMLMPDDSVILIDWEYAGYSDPGIDVGYYIADAAYEPEEAERFIREYLQDDFSEEKLLHFMIYTALISYYWLIWSLQRRALGSPRDDIESTYKFMAEKYAKYLTEKTCK